MTEEQNNLTDSVTNRIDLESPGAMLATARLANNMTLEQAAKELFVTAVKLQALEQDQFEQFNSPIFVRGYLRSYAKLLKIDGNQVVAAFDELLAARAPKSTEAELRAMPENPQKQLWRFGGIIVGIFFIIYLVSIWFFDNGKEAQIKSTNAASVSLEPSIDNLPAPEVASLTSSSSNSSAAQSVTASATTSAVGTSVVTVASTTKSTASASRSVASIAVSASSVSSRAAASVQNSVAQIQSSKASVANLIQTFTKNQRLDEINFSFREESWLEVSDSRGDVLATELQSAGSHLTLTGVAPFDVKLGNSPGVDVKINGKKYPITPLITSKVLILKVTN